MATELKRGAIRVGSNYTRLGLNLLIAVAFLPVIFIGVGAEGLGLIGLLGSGIGIAEMFRGIVHASLKRELGAAYHSANPEDFPNAYNASLVLSSALAGLTLLFFAVLYAILPLLRIPDHLMGAAQWIVIAKGGYSVLFVLFGPAYNLYQVSERMVLHNLWMALYRAGDFGGAVVLFIMLGLRDPAQGLIAYAWISAGIGLLVLFIAVAIILKADRRLIPEPSRIRVSEVRKLLPTAGWNTAVVTAMNMHIRLAHFIMNIAFGLVGNSMFEIAVRLTSYVRIAAFGSTDGIDVVSARLSTTGKGLSVVGLTAYSTRLHTAIAVPSALLILILAEPIIRVWIGWIGRTMEAPEVIPGAVALSQILVIGMAVRGIAESWQRILYGAGFVHRYGPAVILGGVFNPICAVALIVLLPDAIAFQGPAMAYTAAMILVNFIWMPRITAKVLEIRLRDVLSPTIRPAIAGLIASGALWIPYALGRADSIIVLAASIALFGAVHIALCWLFVLDTHERGRFTGALLRRIGSKPAGAAELGVRG